MKLKTDSAFDSNLAPVLIPCPLLVLLVTTAGVSAGVKGTRPAEISRDGVFSLVLPGHLRRDVDSEEKYRAAFFWWGPEKQYCGIHPTRSIQPTAEQLEKFREEYHGVVGQVANGTFHAKISPLERIAIDEDGDLYYYHSVLSRGSGSVSGLLVRGGLLYSISGTLPKDGLSSWVKTMKSIRWRSQGRGVPPVEKRSAVPLLR